MRIEARGRRRRAGEDRGEDSGEDRGGGATTTSRRPARVVRTGEDAGEDRGGGATTTSDEEATTGAGGVSRAVRIGVRIVVKIEAGARRRPADDRRGW